MKLAAAGRFSPNVRIHWYVHSFVTEGGWGDYMEKEDQLAAAAAQ